MSTSPVEYNAVQNEDALIDFLLADLVRPLPSNAPGHWRGIEAGQEDENALIQELVRSGSYTQEEIAAALTHGPTYPELDVDATMDQLEELFAARTPGQANSISDRSN